MARKVSVERVGEIMQAFLRQLKENGGESKFMVLAKQVEPTLNLNEYEQGLYESNGNPRWLGIAHFYSINCVKAGWLNKKSGRWILTEQGEEALKLTPTEFYNQARLNYKEWKEKQETEPIQISDERADVLDEEKEEAQIRQQQAYEIAVESARTEIEESIAAISPYDFQFLVAHLLTAMGYSVPVVAPPGKDGGVDIVAYRDPLGSSAPRIKVQVKHRMQSGTKTTVKEVRELDSLLRKDGDVGLFVSSAGFTSEALRELQLASHHIEAMDLERLIDLWQDHYDNMPEEGRKLLPLVRLYFLAPPRS